MQLGFPSMTASLPLVKDGKLRALGITSAQRSRIAPDVPTIADIAAVFPDHELIKSLGCEAVLNLPVVLQGNLVATINLLDAQHAYTPKIMALAESHLRLPAMLAVLAANGLP